MSGLVDKDVLQGRARDGDRADAPGEGFENLSDELMTPQPFQPKGAVNQLGRASEMLLDQSRKLLGLSRLY